MGAPLHLREQLLELGDLLRRHGGNRIPKRIGVGGDDAHRDAFFDLLLNTVFELLVEHLALRDGELALFDELVEQRL